MSEPTPAFLGGLIAGLVTGMSLMALLKHTTTKADVALPDSMPDFVDKLAQNPDLAYVRLREWEDAEWRHSQGWKGRDLCHNPEGKAVRVLKYYWDEKNDQLIGVVWFGPDAESHRGLCHGGSMTSLLDDFCGHGAFFAGDSPWFGATVRVNVDLKSPIRVGSVLRVIGKVARDGNKKRKVTATIDNGVDDGGEGRIEFAVLDGLSIAGVRLTSSADHNDDVVAKRVFVKKGGENGAPLVLQDSGWDLRD
jgi:acyl-coenzyme A thioesterase PaaI-like protein